MRNTRTSAGYISLIALLLLLVTGCTNAAPAAQDDAAARTAVPPTSTPLPTVTVQATPAPATETPLPTYTPVVPTETPLPTYTPVVPTSTPSLDQEDFGALGSPDAPITIYEFSDYGCHACRQFALHTFAALKAEYIDTGKVYFVHKNYPVVSRHGGMAAQAAECAGEQDAYWEMHDQLYRNPQEWDASPEAAQAAFGRYAAALGLDAEALGACVASERYKPEVDRDVEEALEIGWFGTPTFFINRKMLSGAMPIEAFREVIDRELAE